MRPDYFNKKFQIKFSTVGFIIFIFAVFIFSFLGVSDVFAQEECKSYPGCNYEGTCKVGFYDYDNPPGESGVVNSGLKSCKYRIENNDVPTKGETSRTCGSATTKQYFPISILDGNCPDPGTCTIYGWAVDNAGNIGEEKSIELNICANCVIGGETYEDSECDPTNKCQYCDISKSTTSWSPIPAGGYVCTASGKTPVDSTNYCETPYDNCDDSSTCTGSRLYRGCTGTGSCSILKENGYKIDYPAVCEGLTCQAPYCDDPSNCNGHYKTCNAAGSCSILHNDDSACTTDIECDAYCTDSSTCKGYSKRCTGAANQGSCTITGQVSDSTSCDGLDCGTCCLCASGRSYDSLQDEDCLAGGYTCTNPLTCSGHYHQGICAALDSCGYDPAETPDPSQCDGLDCGICCLCSNGKSPNYTQDGDCDPGGYECSAPLTCSGHYHQGICDETIDYSCTLDPAEIPDPTTCDGLDCGTCCICTSGRSYDSTQDIDCPAGGGECTNPLTCSGYAHQGICQALDSCGLDLTGVPDALQCDGLDCGTCCLCASGRSYDSLQDEDCLAGGYECDNPLTCSGHYHQGICAALDSCGLNPTEVPDTSQCDGLDCEEKSDTCYDYCSSKKLVEYDNDCIRDLTLIFCDKYCDALGICQDCTLPSCPSTITHCCKGVCGAACDDDLDCPGESICQAECTCSGIRECGPETSICCDGFYWCAPGEVYDGENCAPVSSTNYCDIPVESCDDASNCQGSILYKGCSTSHTCSDLPEDVHTEDYDAACDDEPCDDGLWCTINDSCTSGICLGEDRPCGDLNPCTLDSCSEVIPACENIPITECYPDDGACVDGAWYDDHCSDGIQDCDEEGIDYGGVDCLLYCLSIGLAEPVIEPSSPTENTDFTIYCPVSIDIADTLQPDCLNVYATVGDGHQCTFQEWQIATDKAKFTCSGLAAGNYTARCEVVTGTPSNCCSEDAKTKDYSSLNQPPEKPEIPPEYPRGVSWDHCSIKALSIPIFHWIYSDPENNPQKFYEIQVNNETDFSSPEFTYLARSNSPNFKPTPSQVNSWLGEWMDWGDVLYWRVRVNDQEKDSGPDPDHWSDWLEPTEFIFSAHAGSWPEFTPSPSRVSLNQVVELIDNSKCYTSPWNNEFNCQDLPITSYQWDFDYIESAFSVDDTTKGNTTTSYGDLGNYKVKLRIADDIDTCYSETETVTVTLPLPEWMEIPPF